MVVELAVLGVSVIRKTSVADLKEARKGTKQVSN